MTVPGQGYRFVADVTEVDEEAIVRERPAAAVTVDMTEAAPAAAAATAELPQR